MGRILNVVFVKHNFSLKILHGNPSIKLKSFELLTYLIKHIVATF